MTNTAENLIALCQSYLDNQLEVSVYIDRFEGIYLDRQDELTEAEFNIIDAIFMDNDNFEPHPLIREDFTDYIDEAELRRRTQMNIDKLTAA